MSNTTHKKPNKVLFFSYWYPNAVLSNQAYFAKQHAQALNKVFSVEVLAVHILEGKGIYNRRYQCELDENGIKTHRIYIQSKFYKLFYVALPWQYLLIKRIIRQNIIETFAFNTIHSNVIYPCGIVGYQLSKYFKTKHVITEHWSKLDKFFKVSAYKNIGRKAYELADALSAVSQQLANTMQKYHNNQVTMLVPNVIDGSNFFYNEKVQKNKILTFTAVAHWQAPKNPFYFLEALHILYIEKKMPPFKIVLIGEGEILCNVKENKYPYPIEMPGNLSASELCLHLNQCHFFLHGSDFETFSVVMVEALICGLPSIVSAVGIARELINENNGFIAENNTADWQIKIEKLLQTNYDAKLISEQIGERYSLKAVGSCFEKLYQKAGISS
ncbi:MAG: glycosyltransferase [Bacteroidota bacterium]